MKMAPLRCLSDVTPNSRRSCSGRIMETMLNNSYSVMTVFISQADDLEVLPGQTDLHSDRGSRYGELILLLK